MKKTRKLKLKMTYKGEDYLTKQKKRKQQQLQQPPLYLSEIFGSLVKD